MERVVFANVLESMMMKQSELNCLLQYTVLHKASTNTYINGACLDEVVYYSDYADIIFQSTVCKGSFVKL